jgi:hypothetical protein
MVELEKDERIVTKNTDGTYTIELSQVQRYPAEVVKKMLDSWRTDIKDKEQWLKDFEIKKQQAITEATQQLELMKLKIEQDLVFLKEGIELWSKPKHG